MKIFIKNEKNYRWFRKGLKFNIPVCCILFFCYEWQIIQQKIPEYSDGMNGIIRCPNCIGEKL